MINIEKIKNKILKIEREALSNINKPDDNQIVAKIMKIYEEECSTDDNN